MPTLILSPRYTSDSNILWLAAVKHPEWDVERLHGWEEHPSMAALVDPVLYGESMFVRKMADQLGIRLVEPALDWLPNIPERYRCRKVVLTTYQQARLLAGPVFLKPADGKTFRAGVFGSGAELPEGPNDGDPVLVSDPVSFVEEWRAFVLDRQIMTMCRYDVEGEEQDDTEARAFLQKVLDDAGVVVPYAIVIDTGLLSTGERVVIEANPAWGSGIYTCDPVLALTVIREANKVDRNR